MKLGLVLLGACAASPAATGPAVASLSDVVISRFFVEQLVNFPRFVVSGGWLRAWRASR